MLQIAQIIKTAREKKGLSQQEVANLLNEKRSTYAEWEKDTEPKVSTFMKLAEILELNPVEIFKEYKLSINKAGIVTLKIEGIQASLEELKKLLNSGDPKKVGPRSLRNPGVNRPDEIPKFGDISKAPDQDHKPDSKSAKGKKNKGRGPQN